MVAKTLLLVGDENFLAKYRSHLAEIPNCIIVEITNPFKAWNIASNTAPGPDLVVTNYSFGYYPMTGSYKMTGPRLVSAIRNTGSHARFILCGSDDASTVTPVLEQLRTEGSHVEYLRVGNDVQQDDHQQGLADLVRSMLGG